MQAGWQRTGAAGGFARLRYERHGGLHLLQLLFRQCPVKVDLAEQIYKWRQDLDGLGKANTGKKIMSGGMKFLMERPALFNAALWAAPVINSLPRFMKYNDLDDWGKGRELPEFAKESFNEMWKKNKVQGKEETK